MSEDNKESIETKPEEKIDKNRDELLFDDINIDGIVVSKWSFGKLAKVSVHLSSMLDKMDERGLSIDNILSQGFSIDTLTRLAVTLAASDEILNIVSISIGKDIKEIEDMDMDKGIALVIAIAHQNWNTIKNAIAPLLNLPKEVEEKPKKGRKKTQK